ncbi:hypothetical protein D3C77_638450 [compost metagenome]
MAPVLDLVLGQQARLIKEEASSEQRQFKQAVGGYKYVRGKILNPIGLLQIRDAISRLLFAL